MNPLARTSIAALAIALSVAGCTAAKSDPPAPTASGSAGVATSATSFRYKPTIVDFCSSTNLVVVADLGLTFKKQSKTPPSSGPGEACLFEGTSATGQTANLRVEAVALSSQDQAKLLYGAQRQTTRMQVDGPVDGLGEEAEGLSLETEPGFKYSEYRVHARKGNLVIEVWLAVGGTQFTPKQILAAKAKTLASAALATATEAWKA